MFHYGPFCKDAHSYAVPHNPFRYVAVRVTTMIGKPADIAFPCGVDELSIGTFFKPGVLHRVLRESLESLTSSFCNIIK